MEGPDNERLPDDLEGIDARLREERVEPDPFKLDQLQQRVFAQLNPRYRRRTLMRARIATILTSLALVAGAGGALAIAEVGSHSDTHGGAASKQYKPPKHCGKHHNKKCKKHHQKKHHKKHHKKKHHKPCDRDFRHPDRGSDKREHGEHRRC